MERLAVARNKPTPHGSVEPRAPSLVVGKVTAEHGVQGVEIEVGEELLAALVGFGCLVRPIAGDRVLAARIPGGVFVLSVLERRAPDSATLALPSGGALVVEAEDIGLVARKAFSVDARSIGLRAQKFNVVADTLSSARARGQLGRRPVARVGKDAGNHRRHDQFEIARSRDDRRAGRRAARADPVADHRRRRGDKRADRRDRDVRGSAARRQARDGRLTSGELRR